MSTKTCTILISNAQIDYFLTYRCKQKKQIDNEIEKMKSSFYLCSALL